MQYIKKTAAWLTLLLFLVSCGAKQPPMAFAQSFECVMSVSLGDVTFTGKLTRPLVSCYTFCVTEPQNWAGLTLQNQGGKYTCSFEEIEAAMSQPLPATAMTESVMAALDHLSRNPQTEPCYQNQTEIAFRGKTEAGDYQITFDQKNKRPLRIELQNGTRAVMTYE